MSEPTTITIDGLAASGKSTVAARLAAWLDYLYFDTGVMYRAVTRAALDRELDPRDAEQVSRLAEAIQITVEPAERDKKPPYRVLVDNADVTARLRRPEVDRCVSQVASYPRVRQALTRQQRRIAAQQDIVMVGRDIGTVVLPEADLKIFLKASVEERARRRYKEALAKNKAVEYEEILDSMIKRDKQDQENPVSPTRPADDAVIINTDGLTIDQVLDRLKQLVYQQSHGVA